MSLRGVVITNAHDAARVLDSARLLPMFLLRLDARVQAAYASWWARMLDYDAQPMTEELVSRSLREDAAQLTALGRDLGLGRLDRWLPTMLRWEFHRAAEEQAGGTASLELSIPGELPWAAPTDSRAPKKPSGKKEHEHREDLARNVLWFYRYKVRRNRRILSARSRPNTAALTPR